MVGRYKDDFDFPFLKNKNKGGMYSVHMLIILIYIRYRLYIILNGRVVG